MNIELYRETYKNLDNGKYRQIVAKAIRHSATGSNKLRSVHISPVTIEPQEGYSMEVTHSSDRCIRLTFSNAYSANQRAKMMQEIKQLAAERLAQFEPMIGYDIEEREAFQSALKALINS